MILLSNFVNNTLELITNYTKTFFTFICYFYAMMFCLILVHFLVKIRFLPKYSNKSKSIVSLRFFPYVKLPKDRDFFQNTLSNSNNSVYSTILPVIDLNDYDFEGVDISKCCFHKSTILPTDTEFFQKIKNKSLVDCTLPSGDYSQYNFKDVCLTRCTFTKDSKLPLNYTFFANLKNNSFIQVTLPNSFNKYCHLYDLSNTELVLPRKINISKEQTAIFFLKSSQLPSFINTTKQTTYKLT